ncbi:MAG: hypothetical protein P4L90_08725 [Rhodopila sp.]|nr:hypothetical protein [Rhodopila sp.]
MRPSHCLMLLLLAAGCAPLDPFQRPHTWAPLGSNDANLRVMVADPNDLSNGVDAPGSLSAEASPAISRLLTGRRAHLPVANASELGGSSASSQDQPVSADPSQAK